MRHGRGTYTWFTGDTYTGEWNNDKMTGSGKLPLWLERYSKESLMTMFSLNDFFMNLNFIIIKNFVL